MSKQLASKLSQMLEGKAKSQAKSAKRKPVVVKGLGIAIIQAKDAEQSTVREKILECVKHNAESIAQAILELEGERDKRVKECSGERKEKKIASVRVQFAQILTILRAVHRGENVDKIKGARNMAEMYAFASRKGTKRGKTSKTFTAEQFQNWNGSTSRIVSEQPGKKATPAERAKYDDSLARLEQHLVNVLNTLYKHEHTTVVPVKAMLAMARKTGKHVRLAKAA